jgi:hypothetical protein
MLVAIIGLGAGLAAAEDDIAGLKELIRKSEVKEPEGGFCSTVNWPPGNQQTKYAFWNRAVAGMRSVDKFSDGSVCSSALVSSAGVENGRQCVHYQWWACGKGNTCASGTAITCRNASGEWHSP